MTNPDRLTGLDSSFLHLERDAAHMHVAALHDVRGPRPTYDELIGLSLAAAPGPPLPPAVGVRAASTRAARCGSTIRISTSPIHVRHTALPRPGGEAQLKRLGGRIFSQALDRYRPLWELWLVEGLAGDRFALLSKTHHALVDGVSGVDIVTVLFDSAPDPMPVPRPSTSGSRGRCRVRRSCWPTRWWSEPPRRPRSCAASGPRSVGPGQSRARSASRWSASGRWPGLELPGRADEPVQRADRAAPPVHLGARRPGAVQGGQERARRHRQRRRPGGRRRRAGPLPATRRAPHRRARAQGDGAGLGPRRRRAWRAGQPRRRDVGAAAGRDDRPGRAAAHDQRRRWMGSRSPARRSARRS